MKGIGFENFKLFENQQWLDFRSLTLLTGTNNSGKSSVINCMKLMQENIDSIGLDSLLSTNFTVKDPIKYGSIKSYANNSNRNKNDNFSIKIKRNSLDYKLIFKIFDGLEDYARIEYVIISDPNTKDVIFRLQNKDFNNEPKYLFNINYIYILETLHKKIENTIILHKRLKDLKKLLLKVNDKKSSLNDAQNFANMISDEVGINITLEKRISFSIDQMNEIGEMDESENNKKEKYEYIISKTPLAATIKKKNVEEIGVLFTKSEYGNGEKLISEKEIKKDYLSFINKRYIDFNLIWSEAPKYKRDFETLICKFYKTEVIDLAYVKLNRDFIERISNLYWEIDFDFDYLYFNNIVPQLLVNFFNKFNDFGVLSSFLTKSRYDDNDKKASYTLNNSVYGLCSLRNKEVDNENQSTEFNIILEMFSEIIFEIFKDKDFNNKSGKLLHSKAYGNLNDNIFFSETRLYITNMIEKLLLKVYFKFQNSFISSARFTTNRVYNMQENSDFVKQLSNINNNENKLKIYEFINKWLKNLEIADEFVTTSDSEAGSFKAYLVVGGKRTILTDFGLGTNQVLPIIFSLAIHKTAKDYHFEEYYSSRTVVIEEPESNLHPALQSKLADLFVDAIKTFNLQIIVETHSEYLIRKLQYLIGSNKSEVTPDDAVIYYFYKPSHEGVIKGDVKQVEKIEIDEFGRLTKEFGSGFFDEADKIALDIFLLKQSQSN